MEKEIGECPVCGVEVRITKDGKLWSGFQSERGTEYFPHKCVETKCPMMPNGKTMCGKVTYKGGKAYHDNVMYLCKEHYLLWSKGKLKLVSEKLPINTEYRGVANGN